MKNIVVYYIGSDANTGMFATGFNGSHEEAKAYYLGNRFNVGEGENDYMVMVYAIIYDGKRADVAEIPNGLPDDAMHTITKCVARLTAEVQREVWDGEQELIDKL
jgi:hypothetical protein